MGTTELILVIIFSIIGCLGLLLLIFTIVISYAFFKIGFKRKNVNEIIIHTKEDDIVITKKRKPEICDDFLPTAGVEYII